MAEKEQNYLDLIKGVESEIDEAIALPKKERIGFKVAAVDAKNPDEQVKTEKPVAGEEEVKFEFVTEPAEHDAGKDPKKTGGETTKEKEKTPERQEKIAKLKAEIEDARKEFLKVDYEKNDALSRIRKFFSGSSQFKSSRADLGKNDYDIEKNGKNAGATDYDLQWYRAQYDNKLFDLQKLQVDDARARGASNEELADIYGGFMTEQRIVMENEHDKYKIEYNSGTGLGKFKNKINAIGKRYNDLPLPKKLAIGATMMGAGIVMGPAGLMFMGANTGMALGAGGISAGILKWIRGSLTGVGMAKTMEAKGQMKAKKEVAQSRADFLAFLEKTKDIPEEEKYQILSNKVKDIAIRDEENYISKIKNQDIKQLTTSAAFGTFVGSGAAGHLLGKAWHGVSGFFGGSGVHEAVGTHLTESGPHAGKPLINSMKIVKPWETNGHIHHDSFMHNLKEYLKGSGHVDAAHLDQETANTFKRAAQEYASTHDMSYDEAVKKLSLIQPGTTYDVTWDAKGIPHMHIDDVKFAGGAHHHVAEHITGSHNAAEAVTPAIPESTIDHTPHALTPEPQPDFSGDVNQLKNETYLNMQDVQHHSDALAAGINKESYAVNNAIANHMDRFHDAWKGNPELLDHLKHEYGANDKLLHKLFGEASKFDDANGIKTNTLYMKEVVFGGGNKTFDAWRNVRMEDILNSGEHQKEFLKGLPDKEHRDAFKTLIKMSPAKSGDTVGKWLVRTVLRIPQVAPGK